MIKNIKVDYFKCFENENLEMRPFTILTGTNSSGKSSLIQSILISGNHGSGSDMLDYIEAMGIFDDLKNRYINPKEYQIEIKFTDESTHILKASKEGTEIGETASEYLAYPSNLVYLNSNRISINEINSTNNTFRQDRYFGIDGKYIANYYEKHKEESIAEYLLTYRDEGIMIAATLEAQTNYWLKEITEQSYQFRTIKPTSTIIQALYKLDGLEIKPNNIGAGISYIATIIIAALSAKQGNILIIENPEIHLHPKSQAMMGKFLSFIASRGIQVIVETHNDHFINKVRYQVFRKELASSDVIIHYKEAKSPFEQIEITESGKFSNKNSENCFPQGFYDATLSELFAINRG